MKSEIKAQREALLERLKQVRGPRTQLTFARQLGVYVQNINRYERGLAAPHIDFLIRVALFEKVNLNWLLLGKGKGRKRG